MVSAGSSSFSLESSARSYTSRRQISATELPLAHEVRWPHGWIMMGEPNGRLLRLVLVYVPSEHGDLREQFILDCCLAPSAPSCVAEQ